MSLGPTLSPECVSAFGRQIVDIAIYRDGKPSAIIELKKFDDYNSPVIIVADHDKVVRLSQICHVEAYLGMLITDAVAATCVERRKMLELALGQ